MGGQALAFSFRPSLQDLHENPVADPGGEPRVPRIPPFSLASYVALVVDLASYLSVFVVIVV